MKKFYLLLLVCFFTFSCSKDDETTSIPTLNPPTWIHGTWKVEEGRARVSGLRFTIDDIVLLSLDETSHKENISAITQHGGRATVTENITQELYEPNIYYSIGAYFHYTFRKVDENTVTWKIGSMREIVLKRLL